MSEMAPAPTPDVLRSVEQSFLAELAGAKADGEALQRIRSQYFGPKGKVTLLLRSVGQLPAEQRREAGQSTNAVKQRLEGELDRVAKELEAHALERDLKKSRMDMTLGGRRSRPRGAVHPVNRIVREITDIFHRMGFTVRTGPEVELDWYNFGALNFPDDHPARDMQDTFFIQPPDGRRTLSASSGIGDLVLRTHTSPVQIRSMTEEHAPIRIISPGRVFRCDADASHSPMFHQIEGLWVDEGVSFAHLKGVLTSFIHALFGNRPVRFRPSFFPFVEPGAEMDVQCVFCDGEGCRVCKTTGWMEILGAGMVHPKVLENCGIDPERYTGFAFGLGIDRIAMLRWHIDDLAHLFRSDVRFLSQL
jgi:phenylalanyl-tRNA synthetase alpha chain